MSKLNCEDVIRRLYVYLDGELESGEETDIDEHIRHCQECMGRAEFERRLRRLIQDATDRSAPDSLKRKLAAILDDDKR